TAQSCHECNGRHGLDPDSAALYPDLNRWPPSRDGGRRRKGSWTRHSRQGKWPAVRAFLHHQEPWPGSGSNPVFDDHTGPSGKADPGQRRARRRYREIFLTCPTANLRYRMTDKFTVYLVDDDPGVLKGLSRLLRARGYEVEAYFSPQVFLDEHDMAVPGCAVLDVSMPGLDGLEIQRVLTAAGGFQRPVVFVTGKGDIPPTVRSIKAGAIDFLTKPVKEQDLIEALSRAEARDAKLRRIQSELESMQAKLKRLTPREHEVLTYVVAGRLNKQIAGELGTVEKTIKVHRNRIMEKLVIRMSPDLVRM